MTEVFNREMIKEKNLEVLKKTMEIDKKRVPKDHTAAKKKAEQRKAEMIRGVEDKFAKLL